MRMLFPICPGSALTNDPGGGREVSVKRRIQLKSHEDDIRRWVGEGRSDEWVASALGTSPSSVQSFRSRRRIFRREATVEPRPEEPGDYSTYEGVVEGAHGRGRGIWFDPEVGGDPNYRDVWQKTGKVRVHLGRDRIVLVPEP